MHSFQVPITSRGQNRKSAKQKRLLACACYAGYSYVYALQMNPLVTINMQILCFVNTHGFFSSTSYIKNPTHSHDLTLRTFITDYQINTHSFFNSLTARQEAWGKQHGSIMETVCSILSEKQTYQELSSVLYLELEITKGSPMHKKEQYFLCTQHASED